MAKKKTSPEPAKDTRTIVISLKGTPEFRDWLNGLADHCRTTAVNAMELALVHYAKHVKYSKAAPKRTEGR